MSDGAPPSDGVRLILERYRRLAVVGLSPKADRPSHRAMIHMQANGYDITPVNPSCDEVLGNPCAGSLAEAAERGPLEIVMDKVTTVGTTKFWISRRWGGIPSNVDAVKFVKNAD